MACTLLDSIHHAVAPEKFKGTWPSGGKKENPRDSHHRTSGVARSAKRTSASKTNVYCHVGIKPQRQRPDQSHQPDHSTHDARSLPCGGTATSTRIARSSTSGASPPLPPTRRNLRPPARSCRLDGQFYGGQRSARQLAKYISGDPATLPQARSRPAAARRRSGPENARCIICHFWPPCAFYDVFSRREAAGDQNRKRRYNVRGSVALPQVAENP